MEPSLERQGLLKILLPILLILFGSLAVFNLLMDATLLPRFLFLILLFCWLIFNKKYWHIFQISALPGVLFLAFIYGVINYLFLGQATEGLLELMRIFLGWGIFICLLFLFRNFAVVQKYLLPLIGLIAFAHLVVLGYEYFYLVKNEHWANGLAGHVNLLGSQFFILFGIVGALLIKEKKRNREFYIGLLLLGILVVLPVILKVRSATLAFITLFLFFVVVKWLGKKAALVLGLTITSGLLLMTFIIAGTNLDEHLIAQYQLFEYDWLQTWIERSRVWSNSFPLWMESPIFGKGLGNWQIEFPKTGLSDIYSATMDQTTFQRPHNDLIWTICESGLIGLLFQLIVFAYPFLILIKKKPHQLKTEHIILLGTWLGFLVISCFSFPKERPELILWSMFLLAFLYHEFIDDRSANIDQSKLGQLRYFALIPAVFFLLLIVYRGQGEINTRNMLVSYQANDLTKTVEFSSQAENVFYQIDPTSVPLSWYPATLQFAANEKEKACLNFEKAWQLAPYNFNILNDFGSCQEIAGNRKKAIELYLAALSINPFFEPAKRNLTVVYIKSEQWQEATTWAKKLKDEQLRAEYLEIIESQRLLK